MMNYKNRPIVEMTPEQVAGKCYSDALKIVDIDGRGLKVLAMHITCMLGKNELKQPIWMKREFRDGRIVELEKFEDYLLREPRVGLQVPSLHNLVANLTTMPNGKGMEALHMLRQAIPDFDAKVEQERLQGIMADEAKRGNPIGSNQYQKKEESANFASSSQSVRAESNGVSHYTQRKLDKLIAHPVLLAKVKAGEMSVHAAAIKAGIVVPPSNLALTKRCWSKLNETERGEFLSWISNEV